MKREEKRREVAGPRESDGTRARFIVRQSGGEESCEEGKGPPNARSFNEAVVRNLYGEIGGSHLL